LHNVCVLCICCDAAAAAQGNVDFKFWHASNARQCCCSGCAHAHNTEERPYN
jgi:hypothetical protein